MQAKVVHKQTMSDLQRTLRATHVAEIKKREKGNDPFGIVGERACDCGRKRE
jgi:hypothetical protein